MLQYVLFPFVLIQGMSTEPSSLRRIQFQYPINRLERKDSLKEINKLRAVPESSALPLTAQQRVILEWRMAAQSNFSQNLNVLPLDRVLKSDVVQILRHHSAPRSKIRFEPHCQVNISSSSHDALGKLYVYEPHRHIQASTCFETMQSIVAAVGMELISTSSPRLIIGDTIMAADWAMEPRRGCRRPLDEELHDGFGYRFPTLVMDVAYAASNQQLLKGLSVLMSPQTSVQVVIGFMYYACDGNGKDEAVAKVEAFIFRRNVQNPAQVVQLYPMKHGIPPTLTIHLSDLFFGVVNHLPIELSQRILRDEAITVDLSLLQERMLGEYS
uniref:Uncharacterized protein n=1 Tax=Cryptomonas curvata TaxID=233186 RepID=A0A7S0LU98_9CRYP|mmetsp:Transcript_10396/g.22183  ORF Transcript_10396/g.22183 Transcript_10396/m.22183 type:complete len:327 (+) Transcript_10396:1-981(+)